MTDKTVKTIAHDNNDRIRTLQGARFLFVFMIFLSHYVTPSTIRPFDFGGESGVAFFFVLSGFVLSWGYGPRVSRGEHNEKRFFWGHFWRLYPLHVLMFGVFFVLDRHAGISYDALQLLSNLLAFESWIPSNHTLYTLNGVAWFLSDTLFFYIVFERLYMRLMDMRWRRIAACIAVFAICYGMAAWHVPDGWVNCTLYANPMLRLPDFALGIITYRAVKPLRLGRHCSVADGWADNSARGFAVYGASVAVAVVVATYFIYQQLPCGLRCAMPFWFAMPVAVAGLAVSSPGRDPVARLLASRPMVWLGGISFEIFMSHLLVMRIVRHAVLPDGTVGRDTAYFAMSLAATLVVAWSLRRWFVKPVGKAINSRLLR